MIKTLKNKSIITVIIGITGIFICANIALANESIDRFTANIDINTNGQIDVTESIDYDFGNEKKTRHIPRASI